MKLDLRPIAGEPEFLDPTLAGEWAGALGEVMARVQQPPWCTYAVRHEAMLVGLGGFKGVVDGDGIVEIGYLTFVPEQGRGIARAVVAQLCRIAGEQGATCVLAHTLRETNASTRALSSNDFKFNGEVEDPEDGLVWRWSRKT